MKFPILFSTLAGLALFATGLSGCSRHAEDTQTANIDAAASAVCDGADYMEEFNEIVRSLSGERNDGVQINRGLGVFNTINVTPNKDTMRTSALASIPRAPIEAEGARGTSHMRVHLPEARPGTSRAS